MREFRRIVKEAPSRRAALIGHMDALASQHISCKNCTGKCCTFAANSMQVTPTEALDLYTFLVDEDRWNDDLKRDLLKTIHEYRLDKEVPSNGRRDFMRRYYTCPFFSTGGKGCSIDPEFKPYGCLAFNAKQPGIEDGECCGSDEKLLENFENKEFTQNNLMLSEALGLDWIKKDIPSALLDIAKALHA